MSSYLMLRQIVQNGWTRANRALVTKTIGKANFDDIVAIGKKYNVTGDKYKFSEFAEMLHPECAGVRKGFIEDIKSKLRWENPFVWAIKPQTSAGAEVSMHHGINGKNTIIRDALDDLKNNEEVPPSILKCIRRIDKEFDSLVPLEKDCIGWRGRTEHPICKSCNKDFDLVWNSKVGDKIVPDEGYSYLAFDEGLASHWSSFFTDDSRRTIMYKYRLPKGLKLSRNLEHGGEFVTPRGLSGTVVEKKIVGKHAEITLECEIPQKSNLKEIEEIMKKLGISFDT